MTDVQDARAPAVDPEHLASAEAVGQMRVAALGALSRAAARLPVSRTFLRCGSPQVEVLDAATDARAGLIVTGRTA